MSADKNHTELFERYLKGEMSPQEAHKFEREVLDDPFTQEALEGFESSGINALADVEKLKTQISADKKKVVPFMRIAAAAALLIMGSFVVYTFTDRIHNEQLAMEEESVDEVLQNTPPPDTVSIPEVNQSSVVKKLQIENDPHLTNESTTDHTKQEKLVLGNTKVDAKEVPLNEWESKDLETRPEDDFALEEGVVEIPQELADKEADLSPSTILKGKVADLQVEDVLISDTNATESLDEFIAKEEGSPVKYSQKIAKKSAFSSGAVARSAIASDVIFGRVTDDTGELIPGVNVMIKGTNQGVITNQDGGYELPKTDSMTLVFSFVGFESQEVNVGNRNNLDVTMSGSTELQEVVVVGYGRNDGASNSYSPASPKGGNRSYKEYISSNLVYPNAAKQNQIEGNVILEVSINSSGGIQSIDIKRSLGYGCDKEAIRLVEEGPAWESAKRGNTPIEDTVRVKIKFKLD